MQRAARRSKEVDLPPGPLRKFLERELRGEDPARHGNALRGEKLPGRLVLRRVPLGVDLGNLYTESGQTSQGSFSAGWLAGRPDYPRILKVPGSTRLYRSQFLQVNTRLTALDEIYKIYMLLHRSDLNISAEIRR